MNEEQKCMLRTLIHTRIIELGYALKYITSDVKDVINSEIVRLGEIERELDKV